MKIPQKRLILFCEEINDEGSLSKMLEAEFRENENNESDANA